jgi:nitroimidazol reductase NimA-like FMN-containing flavoprotein (pyridoxamine 5'-phosphate oxidase superfamily)
MDFEPGALTRVRRRAERGHYDRATVYAILDEGILCHVGYQLEHQPVVTPTLYWREGDRLYWHGSAASRMLRKLRGGIPACLTVTLMDALVLARSGFHHSINYRSVMAFGVASELSGHAEKLASLEAFMEKLVPGRWRELRPPTAQEIKATLLLSMPIEQVSAKIRRGPPLDDEEDYRLPIWAGEIPLAVRSGRPRKDPRLMPGVALPRHLARYTLPRRARAG